MSRIKNVEAQLLALPRTMPINTENIVDIYINRQFSDGNHLSRRICLSFEALREKKKNCIIRNLFIDRK